MPLLPISGIDHINMCVTDLERSIAYYRDVFGFEMKEDHRDHPEYPWVGLGVPNVAYLLLYQTDKAKVARDMRIIHFGFALRGDWRMEDVLAKLAAAGVEPKRDKSGKPFVVHHARSSSVYLSDPDGYELDVSLKFGGGQDGAA